MGRIFPRTLSGLTPGEETRDKLGKLPSTSSHALLPAVGDVFLRPESLWAFFSAVDG